jgi:hypothetical protein
MEEEKSGRKKGLILKAKGTCGRNAHLFPKLSLALIINSDLLPMETR